MWLASKYGCIGGWSVSMAVYVAGLDIAGLKRLYVAGMQQLYVDGSHTNAAGLYVHADN